MNFGNFSSVATEQTDGLGNGIGGMTMGFGDNLLDTGFFSSNNAASLAALFAALQTAASGAGTINFQLRDDTRGDQYFDFTQGLDSSVITVGSGPVVTAPGTAVAPEPSSLLLLATGALGFAGMVRRKLHSL